MDNKRTRLRSQIALRRAPQVNAVARKETGQQVDDVVDVEVEGEDDRFLPVVQGVKKRKRDPRGGGRRLQHKLECQEGSVSVSVQENADDASADVKDSDRYSSEGSPGEQAHSARIDGVTQSASTIVIIPEIMPEDQAVMKQLDKRRESSRLRVRPSKFREGFLLGNAKAKGDQKGPEDSPTSLEIVLPMDSHQTTLKGLHGDDSEMATLRCGEGEVTSDRYSQFSSGKSKLKITHQLGNSKAAERRRPAIDPSSGFKTAFDDQGLKTALAVVKRVMQIKSADPFNEPVDPISLEIPDYFDVIKEPMDLGTIRDLLETGKKYRTVKEVYADVQLIWSNCRNYNQEGDPIMEILRIAETCFNKHWNAAGLHLLSSDTSLKDDSGMFEVGEEQVATPEQAGSGGSKLRRAKDTPRTSQRIMQFESMTKPRLKSKRSASVEHLMAESKAREDIQDAIGLTVREGDFLENAEDYSTPQRVDREIVADDQMHPSPRVDMAQPSQGSRDSRPEQIIGFREADGMNSSERGQSAVGVEERSKTRMEDADNSARTASSNKRRTFGTVHHKPDCSCVVCVGRRRKLARQGKEGMMIEGHNKKAKSRNRPSIKILQVTESSGGPKVNHVQPTQPQSSDAHATVSVDTEAVDPDQHDRQTGNSTGAETVVEGVRYYPANYEVPLRKLNSSVLQLSRALFGSHYDNVWTRRGSLGLRAPQSSCRKSMLDAVHSLTLSERS